jgi:glycosyltransferase involved in cell wall biosynthesis
MATKSQDLKKQALAHRNLHIVANSRWLEEEARKSRIFDSALSFRTIHLGVDIETFRPRDPLAAKRRFGVDESKTIVAFGSSRLDTPRKGFRELRESLSRLEAKNNIELLTFGDRGTADRPEGITWRNIGPIHSREELAALYNAADIFVMPSLQEAFGQTALEALACATPVVAFDVGGVPDMVRPNQTGLLARVGDVDDLSGRINTLVCDPEQGLRLGRNGRRLIEAEFSLDHQKHGYLDLYRSLAGD